jgi:Family of unknown function (DUF6535)
MADREKKAQGFNTDHNASNLGPPHIRAPDRRRKEVLEMATGVAGEGGRLPGMTKEYSAWDVYNNEARKVDTELVNDWRDSLNSLLLFVSIASSTSTYSYLHQGGHLRRCSYCLHHRKQEGESRLQRLSGHAQIKSTILTDARTGPNNRDNGRDDILHQ